MSKCEQCVASFKPRTDHQRYCSTKCRVAGHRAGKFKPVTRNDDWGEMAANSGNLPDDDHLAQLRQLGSELSSAAEQLMAAMAEAEAESRIAEAKAVTCIKPIKPRAKLTLDSLFKDAGSSGAWHSVTVKGDRPRVRVLEQTSDHMKKEVQHYDTERHD